MPFYFDDTDLERIRNAIDIAEIVSNYVTLKRRGSGDWWGRCPFHNEKTPSFHIRSDRGMFHCFGCGKGGNVFTFLMEIEHISFSEAVRMLAERAGITLRVAHSGGGPDQSRSVNERLFAANTFAMRWFHNNLVGTNPSKEALSVREYLKGRGISTDIIKRFQLGWAEKDWDGLVKAAVNAGISGEILSQTGLASKKKDGSGYVDRFRARLIFPIVALSGKPIAFGGRRIDGITPDDDMVKYINSPETAIYQKGEHLYGLYVAREAIRREGFVYLVEGYIDLLALVQANVLNSVASLGTAMTEAQARLISRFCNKVVIVYDADVAGVNAAIRAADVLVLAGLEVRMAALPTGEDPDSLLRKEGVESLRDTLSKEISFVDFRLKTATGGKNLSQSELLVSVKGILRTIGLLNDPLQRDLLLNELAHKSGIRRDALDKALKHESDSLGSFSMNVPDKQSYLMVNPEQIPERDLLSNILAHPKLVRLAVEELTSEYIEHPGLRELFAELERHYIRGTVIDPAILVSHYDDQSIVEFITSSVLNPVMTSEEEAVEAIYDCIKKLLRRPLIRKSVELEGKILEAQRSGESTQELMRELLEVKQRLRELI